MFDKYNHLLNVVMAVLLSVSPHFMDKFGLSPKAAHAMMAEAEKRAQHMVETGDMSDLKDLDLAMAELEKYRPVFDTVAPVLDKVAARMGVTAGIEQPAQ